MQYIIGKYKVEIYKGNSNYLVGVFRVKESSEDLQDYVNKTITFTGNFNDLNNVDNYKFYGQLIDHERYGTQFLVSNYEVVIPEGKDALIDYLAGPLIKGCGERTAKKIVDILGEDCLNIIKKDENALNLIPGLSTKLALSIRKSILERQSSNELIVYLTGLGFSNQDALNLIKEYNDLVKDIISKNIYDLVGDVDFSKIDEIFLKTNEVNDSFRIKACLVESAKRFCFENGDTYFSYEDLYDKLKKDFNYTLELSDYDYYILELQKEGLLVNHNDKYFLKMYFDMEFNIANNITHIKRANKTSVKKINDYLEFYEKSIDIDYSGEQRKAIIEALKNDVTIITGGPGTGKTTIVKTIVKLYKDLYEIHDETKIVLLAPTGRASKRLSEVSSYGAQTIHRFLKWNKETNDFGINEDNKIYPALVIVDESSMIDTFLFDALLKGLGASTQLILVGDYNQLPSVGPGNVLKDLIDSNMFNHIDLKTIYRQSSDSYIPYLASNIKNKELEETMIEKKDDYNFIICDNLKIKDLVKEICKRLIAKNIGVDDVQVLVPMYKGENGIDALNQVLQELYNPSDDDKNELRYGQVIFRENDKVLQLTNNPDNNIFNGDIGYIEQINHGSKDILRVNFDNNYVSYKKEDLKDLTLAYVISIHKSQGSEFDHIIMPITKNYFRMLYNKLIYTGVSRAKKSLVLLGDPRYFTMAINNDYAKQRKTDLVNKIIETTYTNTSLK